MTDTTSSPAPADLEAQHEHDHAEERRGHNLSMQCWRISQRARAADEWQSAVDFGRQAIELMPGAPEPRFNLAVAYAGLALATDDVDARRSAAATFDDGRQTVAEQDLIRYASEAVSLLEKRQTQLGKEPSYHYGLGTHLAVVGKIVRARRALETAAADSTLAEMATAALADVPEPTIARSAPVGRNDPCPCGSGKKYKRCHGA